MTVADHLVFSMRRIGAMVLRYFFLLRGSIPRIIN